MTYATIPFWQQKNRRRFPGRRFFICGGQLHKSHGRYSIGLCKTAAVSGGRFLSADIVLRRSVLGRPGSDLLFQTLRFSTIGAGENEGDSSFGHIKVYGNPELMTTGVVRQTVPNQPFPAMLEASVFQVFEIPGYGRLHNKSQVVISAVVDAIPPFDAACPCSRAILYDDQNRARGLVDGRMLTLRAPD